MYCKCQHDSKFGYTLQAGMLSKTVSSSQHLLYSPPAWAIQKSIIFHHLKRGELQQILIQDEDTNKNYYATVKDLMWYGRRVDLGRGEQLALDLQYWQNF